MRFVPKQLAVLTLTVAALAPSACHSALAADTPKSVTPTVDVEIEDRAPDKSTHAARFSLSVVDGRAQIGARDGDAKYDIGIHAQPSAEGQYSLILKRGDHGKDGDLDLTSSVPQHAGPRVLVAKIDRADGHVTSVVAQVH
ncbi:MAG: hypothetical protein QOI41_2702 [Myxococcales bacterium]|jgi:hypothetical protein|nr:hypothetical protein [Myxococcales bacterium]